MKYTLLVNKINGVRSIRNNKTGEVIREDQEYDLYTKLRKKAITNIRKAERDSVYRDCCMTKGKDSLGRIMWD